MAFWSLFKKPKLKAEDISIKLFDGKMELNGKLFDVPCHMSVIMEVLGKPKTNNTRSGNLIYTYDDYGIMFYTKGNNVMFCIEVKSNPNERRRKFDPKNAFCGTLIIEGQQWEEFVSEGEDVDFGRRRVCDGTAYIAEYANGEFGDSKGIHGAYYSLSAELATFK